MVRIAHFHWADSGSNPDVGIREYGIISVSSVGRASVLLAEGHGFKPHIENCPISLVVKHFIRKGGRFNSYIGHMFQSGGSLFVIKNLGC